jgi:hypothetical protein
VFFEGDHYNLSKPCRIDDVSSPDVHARLQAWTLYERFAEEKFSSSYCLCSPSPQCRPEPCLRDRYDFVQSPSTSKLCSLQHRIGHCSDYSWNSATGCTGLDVHQHQVSAKICDDRALFIEN